MAQQIISVGSGANDGTGDTLRGGGEKINANFTELYGAIAQAATHVTNTSVAPDIPGEPTVAEVQAVVTSNSYTSRTVYYTGDDTATPANTTHLYWVDSTGTAQLIERSRTKLVKDNSFSGSWFNENAVFRGWGFFLGRVAPFDQIRLRLREFGGGDAITSFAVRIRAGGPNGPVLGEVTDTALNTDANDYRTFAFSGVIDSPADLYAEYVSDGSLGNYSESVTLNTRLDAREVIRYQTATDLTSPFIDTNVDRNIWYQLFNSSGAVYQSDTDADKPELMIPEELLSTVNQDRQYFRFGMTASPDPYRYYWDWFGPAGGKQYRRMYQYTAPASATVNRCVVRLADNTGRTIAAKAVKLRTIAVPANPGASHKVLCIGDSLTAGGQWVTEAERMIAQSGGTPAGHNLTNVDFIGTQGSSPANHEGHSGREWSWMVSDAASPFTNGGGSLDLASYVASNGTPDTVVFFLGWNGFAGKTGDISQPSAWDSVRSNVETFLAAWIAQNASVKMVLCGLQVPSEDGLAENYNDATASDYASYRYCLEGMQGYNRMLQEVCNDYRTGHAEIQQPSNAEVVYCDLASQVDSEYNIATSSVAVNSRTTTTETRGSNGLHPNTDAYEQIADAVVPYILNTI